MCIHSSMMCIRHQYSLMLCIRHIIIAQCCVSGIYNIMGSMLCKPQFMAWCCASGQHHNMAQTCASCINIRLDVLHPWLELCIMPQYGSSHTSYFVHFLFLLCLRLTLEEEEERIWRNASLTQVRFAIWMLHSSHLSSLIGSGRACIWRLATYESQTLHLSWVIAV